MPKNTRMTEGGIRMPSVPPAAIEAVDRSSGYPNRRIEGSAIFVIVAAVAIDDPQTDENPPQATTVAIASPPLRCRSQALAER